MLRTTDAKIAPGERPALWFSKEQHWEPTAQKAWEHPDGKIERLGMMGTFERAQGLGRIGVDPEQVELCNFKTFVATSGIPASNVREMKRVGRLQGANPINWLGSFAPVPLEKWAAVEIYTGTRWEPLENWNA